MKSVLIKTTRDLDSSHKLSDVTRSSTERLNLKSKYRYLLVHLLYQMMDLQIHSEKQGWIKRFHKEDLTKTWVDQIYLCVRVFISSPYYLSEGQLARFCLLPLQWFNLGKLFLPCFFLYNTNIKWKIHSKNGSGFNEHYQNHIVSWKLIETCTL